MNRRKLTGVSFLTAAVLLLLLAGTALVGTVQAATPAPPTASARPTGSQPSLPAQAAARQIAPEPPRTVALQRNLGTWRFAVMQAAPDEAQIQVAHDKRTVQALRSFTQANDTLAGTLRPSNGKFDALITFNRPFTLDEFKKFVADTGIDVSSYTIRMTGPGGKKITVGGGPVNGVLVPQDHLDGRAAAVQQFDAGATVTGVIDVVATFDVSRYSAVKAVSGVFLVDITRTAAVQETRATLSRVAGNKITVDQSRPYEYMEDLGLQNFR